MVSTTLFNDFLSLIYPKQCEACQQVLIEQETFICLNCLVTLPKSKHSLQHGNEILNVLAGRIPLISAMYLYSFEKNNRVQNLLHAIKYEGQKELALFLGKQLALEEEYQNKFQHIDCILPIPLHEKKFKRRGYNQSELFAQGISKELHIPLLNNQLIRLVDSSTQTKKRKYQRWENVAGIFSVREIDSLVNKHILLVDDVVTTGATLEAAWQVLKEIEGVSLSVAAIAFAQKN